MTEGIARARLMFSASEQPTVISFEPLVQEYSLAAGQALFVEVSAAEIAEIEVAVWPTGVAVWLPYPDDHLVFNEHGAEIGRL